MRLTEQPSIRRIGLPKWLENTREQHNGFGYIELERLMNVPEGKRVNVSNLARMYGVARHTMEKWLVIYRDEQADK